MHAVYEQSGAVVMLAAALRAIIYVISKLKNSSTHDEPTFVAAGAGAGEEGLAGGGEGF